MSNKQKSTNNAAQTKQTKQTKKSFRSSMTITLPDGRKKRMYVRGKSQREVDIKLAELQTKYEMGLLVVNQSSTFQHWAEDWLETYKRHKVTAGWYKDIKSILEHWIFPYIGHIPLSKLLPVHVQGCLNQSEGKSYSHAHKVMVILKDCLNKARINGLILSNPAEDLEMPQCTKGERRALTEDERDRLLAVCRDPNTHYGAYFGIMLATGLRPAEAMALTWFNVNMQAQTVTIIRSVKNHSTDIKDPKSEAGKRTIPIPDWYMPYLERLVEKRRSSTYVFTNTRGNMISATSTRKSWAYIAESAQLPSEITPYYLRHTYATLLAENGVDMKTAQYWLGHATIAMTAEIYTHVSKKMLSNAVTKLHGTTEEHAAL